MLEYLLYSPSFRIRIFAVVFRSTLGRQRGTKRGQGETIIERPNANVNVDKKKTISSFIGFR